MSTPTSESLREIPTRPADMLEVDHLIVGAGPAGASLACFLGRYGNYDNTLKIPIRPMFYVLEPLIV
jgi:ribulose 1,5-bisphosphate synthetase/thiazole synthase